ncbi:MAG: PPC domain-containing protein [Isosphaeraceae bacterium]|nr:PPC domain-containing protein [Isosphaeraceae bacterium]
MRRSAVSAIVLLASFTPAARAELPVPRLHQVFPAGAKQGETIEVTVAGQDLEGATRLYFSDPGFTSTKVPDEPKKPTRFKITVAPATPVGFHDVRLVGKHGISNPRTFVVSDWNEINETEPNNERARANRIPIESVINGRIEPGEDVDWFVVSAKKGQRLLVECWAWRIDSRLDGYLWIYNADGKELASSQDENVRNEMRDPLIDFEVPADGDYTIKFTDFTYNGGGDYFYRLQVGTRPLVDFAWPTAAKPGASTKVTLFGRNLPGGEPSPWTIKGRPLEKLEIPVTVPSDSEDAHRPTPGDLVRPSAARLDGFPVRVKTDRGSSNAGVVLFSTLAEVIEHEPNDSRKQAETLTPPCALSGQFQAPKDVDYFAFAAKKGERYEVEVLGERLGSPADPDFEVLNPKGDVMASVQDDGENIGQIRFPTFTRDLKHAFDVPEDGTYTLRLEHLYGQVQGGPQYVYRLVLRPKPAPDFRLVVQPPHETRCDSHVLYRGGRERLDVLVFRLSGHNDPITVDARNLPPGVTAEPIVIGPGLNWGTLVASASAEAPPGEAEIQVVGTSEGPAGKVTHQARGGVIVWDTVNTPAISRMTRSIVLAVRDEAPFTLTAAPAQISKVQGEPLEIDVEVKRRKDMPNALQLVGSGYQLPPNLNIPTTPVAAGESKARVKIATDQVPPGTYSFLINGDGQVPVKDAGGNSRNIRCVYPTNTIKLTITPKPAK